jgi:hypothetical protein
LKDFASRRVEEQDLKRIYEHLITTQSPARTIGIKDILDSAKILSINLKASRNDDWPPHCSETCPACGNVINWTIGESDMCPTCQFPGQAIIDKRIYGKIQKGDYPMTKWFDETVQTCHKAHMAKRV